MPQPCCALASPSRPLPALRLPPTPHSLRQLLRRPDANYLTQQPEINAKMRSILVDWLVEVAEEYKLCADTLYLAVGYLDRLLTVHRVPRAQLQLVGITCMWIAAKYEEIYPPNVNEFTYITDNTYSKEQLVAMEEEVLKKLKYELTVPTAKTFLRRMLQVRGKDKKEWGVWKGGGQQAYGNGGTAAKQGSADVCGSNVAFCHGRPHAWASSAAS